MEDGQLVGGGRLMVVWRGEGLMVVEWCGGKAGRLERETGVEKWKEEDWWEGATLRP